MAITARQLIEKLQALDEQFLDLPVVFTNEGGEADVEQMFVENVAVYDSPKTTYINLIGWDNIF